MAQRLTAEDLVGMLPSELRDVLDDPRTTAKVRRLASGILAGTVIISGVPMEIDDPFEFVEV